MREIKFRAWSEEDKRFDYSDELGLEAFFHYYSEGDQYTGLKDKNGVEIYEGDIVKITQLYLEDDWYEILEVRWASNGYHLYKKDQVGWEATLSRYEEKFRIEVIGNIYENKELL